jgi:hypothetical protein
MVSRSHEAHKRQTPKAGIAHKATRQRNDSKR